MTNQILYDNLGQPVAKESASLANGSTDGFSFVTGDAGGTLSDVKLVLVDATPTDGGSVAVQLYTVATNQGPGSKVADLGLVSDSTLSLSTSASDIPITSNISLAPDTRYYIEATGVLGSKAVLAQESSDAGQGVKGELLYINSFNSSGQLTTNEVEGNSNGAFVGQVTENVVCFASGTLIRVGGKDVLVEDLQVGDIAVTASGAHRAIRWLGHRVVDCRRHPRHHEVQPIRIAAHAFGPDRPTRDLRVSPGHSLCVDLLGEVLIPAGALINGSTIVQEDVETVTYWHVELDGGHDIILAENLPCESYLEMGNRSFFADAGVVALDASPDAPVRTHADFCRPFHAGGPLVDAVRSRLAARAASNVRRDDGEAAEAA